MFSIKKLWSSSFTSSRTYIGFWLYGDYWVMHLKDWFFSNKIALENYGIKQTPTDSNAGGALLYISSLVSLAPWCSGYYCCKKFIQQSLNSGSAQVQVLFTLCWRFKMVRICNNGHSRKYGWTPFFGQPYQESNSSSSSSSSLIQNLKIS